MNNSQIIRIEVGGYRASIHLDQLRTLTIPKYRKLLKLVFSPDNRCPEGAAQLGAYLDQAVRETGYISEALGEFFSVSWREKTKAEHQCWVQRRDTYINMKGSFK